MKLIRDKIPMLMKQAGVKFEARVADNDEYKELLVKKMQEEVKELMEDQDIEEAADVYEVFLALIKLWGHDVHDVVAHAEAKQAERGGFSQRVVLLDSETYKTNTGVSKYTSQLFGTPGED